ncbi:MAG: cation diffusion facilitator family transporter [Coriobacteriales bacterium]|jgi:cation diffusion facilitator family transporter
MPDSSVDKQDEIERAVSRDAQIVRTSVVGIAANVVLAAFKAVFGLLANSISIVLDAVNNISDAASSVITIVGTKLASRSPDKKHPFGYGRIEYLTTIVIAVIVLWAGITSLQESISRIIEPQLASYDTVTLVVVAVAVFAKIALGLYTRRAGDRLGSGALRASGTDALMDSVISAATLAAALVFIFTGIALEAWLGLIIALVVIKAGIDMLREVISRIIGQRVDASVARAVKETVCSVEGVRGAYDLILDDFGPEKLWGSVHVEVDDTMTATQIDAMTRAIQQAVFRKEGVILHTVGIYSTNTDGSVASRIRADLLEVAAAEDMVLETHGLYVDEKEKTVTFDLVVSFDAEDRHAVVERVRSGLATRYPDYKVSATLDSDISD